MDQSDIVPELLDKIQQDFASGCAESEEVKALLEKIESGNADYKDAQAYALEVSKILSESFGRHVSVEVLPDGRMYYNIAKRLLEPTLGKNFDLIADVSEKVQTALNAKARVGIKVMRPALNADRIDGLITKISDAESFEDVAWLLKDPIENFCQSVVDDSVQANCDMQKKVGLQPKVIRTAAPDCCPWCSEKAGTYPYSSTMDQSVFKRHKNCRCTVEFKTADGKTKRHF